MNDDEVQKQAGSQASVSLRMVKLDDNNIRLLLQLLRQNIGAKENLHFNGHYGCKKNNKKRKTPTPAIEQHAPSTNNC